MFPLFGRKFLIEFSLTPLRDQWHLVLKKCQGLFLESNRAIKETTDLPRFVKETKVLKKRIGERSTGVLKDPVSQVKMVFFAKF